MLQPPQTATTQTARNQPTPAQSTSEKILVVGPAWVGDMVMADSFFQLLKQLYPHAHLSVLSPKWCLPLLARMSSVDSFIELPFGHGDFKAMARWRFGRSLATERYSQAYVLPNSWKSAIVPFAAKIAKRTGWIGEMRYGLLNDHRQLDKTQYPTMISRFNALALPTHERLPTPPTPRLSATPAQQSATKTAVSLNSDDYIALCPGAEFGPAKRWPPEHYATICGHLLKQGRSVILLGSPKDQATTQEILRHVPTNTHADILNLAGKTDLAQAIDLLAGAKAAISNDSGLMHIAAAVGRPVVAIYGPTSTTFTPPASDKAMLIQLQLNCQPCHQRNCPLTGENFHACMKQITPEAVLEKLDSLLQ
jgi:heptosyltransferase-2